MKKLTLKDVQETISKLSQQISILSIENKEYGNKGKKEIVCFCECLIDNHCWNASFGNLKKGSGCPKCGGNYRPSIDEIKQRLHVINPHILILDKVYVSSAKRMNCKCLIDGYEWNPTWADLSQKKGCPKCKATLSSVRMSTPNGNSIKDVRPDLIQFLKNKEDAEKYSCSSRSEIELVCPNCFSEKTIKTYRLKTEGFKCNVCSDGISVPEKFGINLLKQIGVDFKTQIKFEWSNKKRYDFIVNEKIIIESHGMQHYKNVTRGRDFEFEKKNDYEKYELALKNGIDSNHYVVVDCRYSEFEWLKENYEKCLSTHFDLTKVDWELVWLNSQSSISKRIWDIWNSQSKKSIIEISKELKLDRTTITKYLKLGNKIGMCKFESRKARDYRLMG